MEKIWAGRAAKHLDQIADDFNASIRFDQRLAVEDLTGSMAHAAMLGAKGINSPEDTETILAGLESILQDLQSGKLQIEVLQNLDKVPAAGAVLVAAWPRLEGATGLPVRVWAICP